MSRIKRVRVAPSFDGDLIVVDVHVRNAAGAYRFAGTLRALRQPARGKPSFFGVYSTHVVPGLRGRGLGTRMYEEAARVACEQGGPLASDHDDRLSPPAQGFWEKQRRKGRAVLRRQGDGRRRYFLRCPAGSLRGARP